MGSDESPALGFRTHIILRGQFALAASTQNLGSDGRQAVRQHRDTPFVEKHRVF